MRGQNVSFLHHFPAFTIRSHFSGGGISQRGAPCGVRTYRFCPFFPCLRYVLPFPAANQPAREPLRGQNVSFLHHFPVFTIRSPFSSGGISQRGPPAESERIVFASFSGVYDTFSLFQRRNQPARAPCEVRTYRFCPFFPCLRYVFTFPAANPPARSPLRGQNVSFLPVFSVFAIRSHFSSSESASAEAHARCGKFELLM